MAKEKKAKERPYRYTESGLDNIYLVNGYKFVETPRGRGVEIQDMEGLHRAIANILVRERKELTGREFRFLRHEINITQQALAALLGVTVLTVGRWEREEGEGVSGPAQRLIRLLYEEKINGNQEISEPLEKLAELDEMYGTAEEITLEKTPQDWQPTPAAA